MVHLLPSTLTYTISGQKLTPACYRDTFLVLSCSSDVPSVSQAYLLKNLSLKMVKNLQTPQVLLSAHTMKSPVLPVLKVELAGFLETLGLNNML
jgi:hypothetical protein